MVTQDREVECYELGHLDQRPNLSTYSIVLLGFSTDEDRIDHVKEELHRAAEQLGTAFPWVHGRVRHTTDEQDELTSGTYSIDLSTKGSILDVQNGKIGLGSYEKIISKGAPMHMLPAQLLTDQRGFPEHIDPSKEHAPVFSIKATFVEGGLLLCFATNHNVSDMTGQAQLILLFAHAMSGRSFTQTQVESGNVSRKLTIPRLDSNGTRMDFPKFRTETPRRDSVKSADTEAKTQATWKVVRFPAKSLSCLKMAANRAIDGEDTPIDETIGGWASTNDALSAFLWQRISTARKFSADLHHETRIVRILNCRGRVNPPVSREYIGNFVFATFLSSPTLQVQDSLQFATIAKRLRQAVHEATDYTIRAFVSAIAEDPDKSAYDFDASVRSSYDLTISSWAEMGLSKIDFGCLSTPDFVRRPLMASSESCVYLVDKTSHGDIEAAMCLGENDWLALAGDEVWNRHAVMVG